MAPKKTVREIPFSRIPHDFELASYFWFNGDFMPAVFAKNGGYEIRVVKSRTVSGPNEIVTYDYFKLDADGNVLVAPRGYARDYKPGRVVGLDDAVAKYSTPDSSTIRMRL